MGEARGTYGRRGWMYTGFRQGNVREVHYLEHADPDGWIILKSAFEKHDEASRGLDCSGSG